MASLDTTNPSEELWTFYSTEGKVKYEIPVQVAKLSGTFTNMIENSQNEKAVSFPVVTQQWECSNKTYQINTDELLNYVYKYFKLWESEPSKADYVKVEPVQTSEISHILQPKDIAYIEEYLDDYLKQAGNKKLTPKELREWKTEGLGILLSQVDEFLDIQSLANKLYAYVAVIIWNTSPVDFAEALQDPEFKKAQDVAVAAWTKDNPNKFTNYVRSHTTDGVYLAPPVAPLAIDDIDLEDLSLEAENAALDAVSSSSDSDDANSDA